MRWLKSAVCGLTGPVPMVEQSAFAALELCDRCYLLESGEMTLSGTGEELLNDPHVKAAHLGG